MVSQQTPELQVVGESMTGLTKSEQELINGIHEIVSAISGLRIALEEFELSVRTSRYEEQERQARVEREQQVL